MNGKGSTRRPQAIDAQRFADNWDRVFAPSAARSSIYRAIASAPFESTKAVSELGIYAHLPSHALVERTDFEFIDITQLVERR